MNRQDVPNINKAQKQLSQLVKSEANWVKLLCSQLVDEACAPCSWDEIIYNKIKDPNHFRSQRIVKKCDEGHYQHIAEQTYIEVNIDELINESIMLGNRRNVK